ncbi:hypothetical protein [Pseudoruegeria sp. SK021]|uniref:hypothetical protein n=1 Tax=Pseudoruegeria sp. SK021 TaxID=1933035 RepID=UPI000A2424B5|nr:hypothetical protein [Pseudoruegeria sp. SK021]OSP54937.1 hypothetical protein BV911_09820 [Pseudoruegeria sp. SK021]
MIDRRKPVFLERQTYRRHRLIDASRLVPLAGAFLFFVPLLWEYKVVAPDEQGFLAERMVYLFAVWFGLVVLAARIAARLRPEDFDRDHEVDVDPDSRDRG